LTAATFRRNLDDGARATFSLANGVGHCHDHPHLDDRRLGHQGRRQDGQHQGHQGHHLDDRRQDHQSCDLGHLGDQRQGHRLGDQRRGRLDALGHQCQLGHDRVHLLEDGQCVRQHRHLDDQHQGRQDVGPLVADQLQARLGEHCLVVEELDDRHQEAVELDDHLAQCAVQLVQEQVRLVKKWLRQVQAQQVSLVRLARLVQRDALQRASQQGPRW
jgi:hypothetical protein